MFAKIIIKDFNKWLTNCIFTKIFKICKVIPVYKRDKPTDENNCRPMRILSNLSKIYENFIVQLFYGKR